MAYNYLLELYESIEHRLEDTLDNLEQKSEELSEDQIRFHEGRKEILEEFHEFLQSNYHRLLPRKIRERVEKYGAKGMN